MLLSHYNFFIILLFYTYLYFSCFSKIYIFQKYYIYILCYIIVLYILIATNEIDVDSGKDTKDPCTEAREECQTIRCPYGKEAFVDSQDCERCRCVDPCRTQICSDNTKCAITLVATKDGTEYKGVCRSGNYKIKFLFYILYSIFLLFYIFQ